jgi:hypothetical protein
VPSVLLDCWSKYRRSSRSHLRAVSFNLPAEASGFPTTGCSTYVASEHTRTSRHPRHFKHRLVRLTIRPASSWTNLTVIIQLTSVVSTTEIRYSFRKTNYHKPNWLIMFFWVLAPCRFFGRSQRFAETYCLHLQVTSWQQWLSVALVKLIPLGGLKQLGAGFRWRHTIVWRLRLVVAAVKFEQSGVRCTDRQRSYGHSRTERERDWGNTARRQALPGALTQTGICGLRARKFASLPVA